MAANIDSEVCSVTAPDEGTAMSVNRKVAELLDLCIFKVSMMCGASSGISVNSLPICLSEK